MDTLDVTPSTAVCGATVQGLDLRRRIGDGTIRALRRAWLAHKVLAFPDQRLDLEDLPRLAAAFGPFGEDRYIASIPGHPHVIEVRREPDETTPLFAEAWHSDWSFLPTPPAASFAYGAVIPPVGGDTLFADMTAALAALSPARQIELSALFGVHSARRGYSVRGAYGERDKDRSMHIVASDTALATQRHPLVRPHSETGEPALFCSLAYTIGIEGLDDGEATALLAELQAHATQERFVYRHIWEQDMLVVWDNRCVLHSATGGYEGYRRVLQRVTVADDPAWYEGAAPPHSEPS